MIRSHTTLRRGTAIAIIVQAGGSNHLFCAREDGSITHDIGTGRLERFQYHERLTATTQLEWQARTQTLLVNIGTQISASPSGRIQLRPHVFDHRVGHTTQQTLVNADITAFLLSTSAFEELWHSESRLFMSSKHSKDGGQWHVHPDSELPAVSCGRCECKGVKLGNTGCARHDEMRIRLIPVGPLKHS